VRTRVGKHSCLEISTRHCAIPLGKMKLAGEYHCRALGEASESPRQQRETRMENIASLTESEKSAKTLTTVIYALYAASFFVGVTAIVAIVMNYVKKDDMAGTFLESHFRWQIRTFWFGLLWGVLGYITVLLVFGWLILAANGVWMIYRIVKGWLRLNDNKAMYTA
jgi:uncharacterized membrane protein